MVTPHQIDRAAQNGALAAQGEMEGKTINELLTLADRYYWRRVTTVTGTATHAWLVAAHATVEAEIKRQARLLGA